eukprot:8807421-Pyramimonas_sp.AAC.1
MSQNLQNWMDVRKYVRYYLPTKKMGRHRVIMRIYVCWTGQSRGSMCMHVPDRCSCGGYRFANTPSEGSLTAR